MKELTQYDRVTTYIDKISDYIRKEMFPELEKPVITLQKTTGAYGHFESVPMWKASDGTARYEINLGSETITRPIENVVATLIHEYTHYYNHIKGIQDCSRGGSYHNKKFKEEAEKHMLSISHHDKYGWTITEPTEALLNWCIEHNLQDIQLGRGVNFWDLFSGIKIGTDNKGKTTTTPINVKKPSSTRKYICTKCGCTVRATKDVNIICADCMQVMEKCD